jgi:hypothetical protein
MTIKLLNRKNDWKDIEELIDTRKKLQNMGMTDELHGKLKEKYVKNRIDRDDVYFFGYYEEGELTAVSSFHRCPLRYDIVAGITWTKEGNKTPRWPTAQHYSTSIIELRNYAVEFFIREINLHTMWVIGPADNTWERLIEVEGCVLADREKFDKEVVMVIPALEFSDIPFIDQFVLVDHPLPTDQVVFRLTRIDWKDPNLGDDAPPQGKVPTEHIMPERGVIPVEHEMPPRGKLK